MESNRRALWILAFVTFVFGDLVTTGIGLHLGLAESHPLYDSFLPANLLAVAFAVKLIVVAFFLVLYRLVPSPVNVGIPVGLSLLGVAVTGWNTYLILSVA